MRHVTIFVIAILLSLIGCEKKEQIPAPAVKTVEEKPVLQLPTATEVFNLRSQCAKMGEDVLSSNIVGTALTQSKISYYDPKKNRCFVELDVNSVDLTLPVDKSIHSRHLFDGQTNELIATTDIKNGEESGIVFKQSIYGFDNVNEYINQIMDDADYSPRKAS